MSTTHAVSAQNPPQFYWTQEIWNLAWNSQESSSMKVLCAKVACIVFPILLSVAIVEGIIWAVRSIFKISGNPKSAPMDPQSVKQTLSEVEQKPRQQDQQHTPGLVDQTDLRPTFPSFQIDAQGQTSVSVQEPKPEFFLTEPAALEKTENDGQAVKNPKIITVALPAAPNPDHLQANSRTYLALLYAHYANLAFESNAARIQEQRIDELARDQERIMEFAINDYLKTVENEPTIKESADLNTIRLKDPQFLLRRQLYFQPTNHEPLTVAERSKIIVEHLFIPQPKPIWYIPPIKTQIALIECANMQTISVFCVGDQTMVFNSHRNEITLTKGKKATQAYLTGILGPYPYFSYTLGQYDRARKDQEPSGTLPVQEQERAEPSQVELAEPVRGLVEAVKNPDIITVALPAGSSLHDIVDNQNDLENVRPSAGVYHAVKFASFFAVRFDTFVTNIQEQNAKELAFLQRRMIEMGTEDYFFGLNNEPSIKDSVDLDAIKIKDPFALQFANLYFEPTNQEHKPVAERTRVIVEHLFIPQEKPVGRESPLKIFQLSFLKNSDNQTIALVCTDERVIVFNPHKNEITMTIGKDATQAHLIAMLGHKPFSYALGQYNALKLE